MGSGNSETCHIHPKHTPVTVVRTKPN